MDSSAASLRNSASEERKRKRTTIVVTKFPRKSTSIETFQQNVSTQMIWQEASAIQTTDLTTEVSSKRREQPSEAEVAVVPSKSEGGRSSKNSTLMCLKSLWIALKTRVKSLQEMQKFARHAQVSSASSVN